MIAKLYVKPEFSERELMKNKEKVHVNCSSALQSAKFIALTPDRVLMKVEKSFKFQGARYEQNSSLLYWCFYNYFNIGNVLLCVICLFNLTVLQRSTK